MNFIIPVARPFLHCELSAIREDKKIFFFVFLVVEPQRSFEENKVFSGSADPPPHLLLVVRPLTNYLFFGVSSLSYRSIRGFGFIQATERSA